MTQNAQHLRAVFASLLLSISLLAGGCTRMQESPSAVLVREHQLPVVMVVSPDSSQVRPAVRALRQELQTQYDVVLKTIAPEATSQELGAAIVNTKPTVVVLINNPTVELYRVWAKTVAAPPPCVVLLSSFVSEVLTDVPNATGIHYEVPAVTTIVDLRTLLRRPIARVGVVYRRKFRAHVQAQRQLALTEGITLVAVELLDPAGPSDVRRALDALEVDRIDALWMPNDNRLFTHRLLEDVWFPAFQDGAYPVIVGVPSLIDERRHLGTFAAVPDPDALGVQAADLIGQLAENGWRTDRVPVQLPLSTRTYLDLQRAQRFGISATAATLVDVAVGAEQ